MARYTNKIVVVTGASKGIGAGIAKRLAAEGATVVVNYVSSKSGADAVVSDIERLGGHALALGGNVANEAQVTELFEAVRSAFGRVDVLVNNAGVYAPAPLDVLSVAEFHRHFDINVLGLLLATKAAMPLFPEAGGSIVNISSIVSTFAPPDAAVYVGTKGAVDAITKSLAKEFAPRRVRVNAVRPGFVLTEGVDAAGMSGGEFEAQMLALTPLGRAGQPADIAAAVAFLASDEASWITGDTMNVAGGAGM
jgi:3-oxoacyl-[acyl-carrier protein] reductase